MKSLIKQAAMSVASVSPVLRRFVKERDEMLYWRKRFRSEGTLNNAHYMHFYTDQF